MAVKVAINGFGRIGRLAFRQMFGAEGFEIVAINDLLDADYMAYMLRYDTIHGKFQGEISYDDESITVNGHKVNIPSFLVKPGDVIEVAEKSRSSVKFKRLTGEDAVMVTLPQWLEREKNTLKGTVTKLPAREDIDMPIEEHLIVELYSK